MVICYKCCIVTIQSLTVRRMEGSTTLASVVANWMAASVTNHCHCFTNCSVPGVERTVRPSYLGAVFLFFSRKFDTICHTSAPAKASTCTWFRTPTFSLTVTQKMLQNVENTQRITFKTAYWPLMQHQDWNCTHRVVLVLKNDDFWAICWTVRLFMPN